jgi:Flp pilus assembly protein TadD
MRLGSTFTGLVLGAIALSCALGLRCVVGSGAEQAGAVTFSRDIAPIVLVHCAPCHRPGEAGPFDLLDYDDVSSRARQIAQVTRSRYMPPWLPDTPGVAYVGERRLDAGQIALFERWYEQGTPEGDPAELPPPPEFHTGWQLGEPDLVLELPEPFTLPAEGADWVRNFVLAASVDRPRWVRALEIRPGNARIVHHAILKRDRTRRARLADERDPAPGFGGMEMGGADYPEGQILVWTPGTLPREDGAGIPWSLEPGADLVLQLHMVPSGKPETVQARLGFHFTDEAPARTPRTVLMRNDRIDIPPGASEYVIEDRFVLPVAVTVLGLYPHAHYLARGMEIWAEPPAGDRIWLLRIPAWDFNWQGMYHLREPIELERGATLRLRYSYDNSVANPANPRRPPVRVRIGNQSSDEMATLAVQLLLDDDRAANELAIAQWEDLLRDHPENPAGHYNLGVAWATAGDLEQAALHYERALALAPGDAATHHYLASVYYRLGRLEPALEHYAAAVAHDPSFVDAHVVLGYLLTRRGEHERAILHLERALELDPGLARAHDFLGQAHERRGARSQALECYRRALALDPTLDDVRQAIGRLER